MEIENEGLRRWGHTAHLESDIGFVIVYGGRVKNVKKAGNCYAVPFMRCSLGMIRSHMRVLARLGFQTISFLLAERKEAQVVRPVPTKAEMRLGFEAPELFHHTSCLYAGVLLVIFGGYLRADKSKRPSNKLYAFDLGT
jgi:hypothetical protein